MESVPAAASIPVFLPFVMGSNAQSDAQGALVGMTAGHTRADVARAIYEGIVFGHRHHFRKLLATRTRPVQAIRLAGGAARSAVWAQMFADVMQYPVETKETGALGCAMAAAVAVGDFESLGDAARQMVRVDRRYEPNETLGAVYDRKYERYERAVAALEPYWDQLSKTQHDA